MRACHERRGPRWIEQINADRIVQHEQVRIEIAIR